MKKLNNNKLISRVAAASALSMPIGSTDEQHFLCTPEHYQMLSVMVDAFKSIQTIRGNKNSLKFDSTNKDDLIHYQNLLTGAKVREKRYLKRVLDFENALTVCLNNHNVFNQGFQCYLFDILESQKELLEVAQLDISHYKGLLN